MYRRWSFKCCYQYNPHTNGSVSLSLSPCGWSPWSSDREPCEGRGISAVYYLFLRSFSEGIIQSWETGCIINNAGSFLSAFRPQCLSIIALCRRPPLCARSFFLPAPSAPSLWRRPTRPRYRIKTTVMAKISSHHWRAHTSVYDITHSSTRAWVTRQQFILYIYYTSIVI